MSTSMFPFSTIDGMKEAAEIMQKMSTRRYETDVMRVGVAWIFSACGKCAYCASGRENLCAGFRATGREANGGYAEYMTAHADYVHPIPDGLSGADAAPLLCAGAVGYRALMLTGIDDGATLGLYGFGASNHLVLKTAPEEISPVENLRL